MGPLDLLPTEVLVEIFKRLQVKDILTMRWVSTRMKIVAREKEIWKGVVMKSTYPPPYNRENLYVENGYNR